MAKFSALIEDLVTANHILANEGIVDTFGHVSIRPSASFTAQPMRHGRT